MASNTVVSAFFGVFEPDPDWEKQRLNKAPFHLTDNVIVSFAPIVLANGQYTLEFQEPAASEKRVEKLLQRVKLVNPHAEVHVSVCSDQNDPNSFVNAAQDKNFAQNVAIFMEKYGFKGLNLDWELNIQAQPLNNLAAHLHHEFRSKQHSLSLDGIFIGSQDLSGIYDMQVLQKYLNFYLMTYGSNCDYQAYLNGYTELGFPIDQMSLGIESEYTFKEGVDTPGPGGSIEAKAKFALANGKKIFNWRLDNDYAENPNEPTFQCQKQLWSSMKGGD